MSDKSGLHIWVIKDKIEEFREAKNKVRFESSPFTVADTTWQLVCYPNGSKFSNLGSVMVFLRLLTMPQSCRNGGILTVTFRLQCLETKSSSTFIETYTHSNDSKGWQARNVLLSSLILESIKTVTIQCDLKILKMLNNNLKITYQAPLKIYSDKFSFEWKLTDSLMDRFQFAHNGQWFESANYNNLWCLKCAPNGYNLSNDGCCILFVQICGLPPNIQRMKCKVKLSCLETGTKWTIKKEFGYDSKNCGWTATKLPFKKLLKCDAITFMAEIDIIGMYDLYGNKQDHNHNHNDNYNDYAFDNNDRNDGNLENKVNSLTKKLNKMNVVLNELAHISKKNDQDIALLKNEMKLLKEMNGIKKPNRSKALSVGAINNNDLLDMFTINEHANANANADANTDAFGAWETF